VHVVIHVAWRCATDTQGAISDNSRDGDLETLMTNQSIASRVLEAVKRVEAGELPVSAIASSLEMHEPALEGVPRDVRDRLHKLAVDAIRQDVSAREREQLGIEGSRQALMELKAILVGLAEETL